MTVHMIRMKMCKSMSKSDAQSVIDTWVNNHDPWVEGTQDSLSVSNTSLDGSGTEYYVYNARFNMQDTTKTELLDAIETELQNHCSWYTIGYHECSHDEDSPGNCSWEDNRKYGTLPDGVTGF